MDGIVRDESNQRVFSSPEDYDEWRQVMRGHWERGVEILMTKTVQESDWLHTIRACVPE